MRLPHSQCAGSTLRAMRFAAFPLLSASSAAPVDWSDGREKKAGLRGVGRDAGKPPPAAMRLQARSRISREKRAGMPDLGKVARWRGGA